jgi:hypothetical protein
VAERDRSNLTTPSPVCSAVSRLVRSCDGVRREQRSDAVAKIATGGPRRPGPSLDRLVAALSRRYVNDVTHGHRATPIGQHERGPRGALIRKQLVDALNLPPCEPVFDVQVEAD